jgi:acetylserotonin N-methyltransferase
VAACERYPSLQAVVFDLSEAVPLAQEMIAPTSAAARVSVVAGNFFTDELPEADLFAVGRILHDWSEDKIVTLLRKVYERLPSGGALLVAEKVLDDNRAGPVWEQMQSLNMLLVTEGKERTLAEYEVLLRQAGFAQVEGRKTSSPLDAVLAVKK